jgi:hypothetical protein
VASAGHPGEHEPEARGIPRGLGADGGDGADRGAGEVAVDEKAGGRATARFGEARLDVALRRFDLGVGLRPGRRRQGRRAGDRPACSAELAGTCRLAAAAGRLRVEAARRAAGGSGWGRGADAGGTPPPAELVAAAGTLGLRWPCTAADAKAAYRRAVLRAHPDQGGSPEAFRRVQGAYDEIRLRLGVA